MYPPGTLATATVRGVADVPVMAVVDGSAAGWLSALPIGTFTFHSDDQVTDVTQTFPLALAAGDLDALDQVISTGAATAETIAILADLRARIVTARAGSSKPPEPLARGSVVVDVDGREWVRVGGSNVRKAWFQLALAAYGYTWDDFEAIRVLP